MMRLKFLNYCSRYQRVELESLTRHTLGLFKEVFYLKNNMFVLTHFQSEFPEMKSYINISHLRALSRRSCTFQQS